MHRPHWPSWVYSTLNDAGMRLLESSIVEAKATGKYERGTRISAADHATAVVALLNIMGRTDLFKIDR
jgi:hypothetical protein